MGLTTIKITRQPGEFTKGFLSFSGITLPCALGRTGTTLAKREGDGATPMLVARPLYGMYRRDRVPLPPTILPFQEIRANMGWCDEISHPAYNRPVKLPFSASHEELQRKDELYNYVIVLDINISSRIKGRGSAIFFHVARPNYTPTEGCVAISQRDMQRLLPLVSKETRFHIAV